MYDSETKIMTWGRSRSTYIPLPSKKAKVQKSIGKIMLVVSWNCRGVILTDYLPKNQTITGVSYSTLLGKSRDVVIKKTPRYAHQNCSSTYGQDTSSLIASSGWESKVIWFLNLAPFSLFSRSYIPSDFYFFPKLKNPLRGQRFDDTNDVIQEM